MINQYCMEILTKEQYNNINEKEYNVFMYEKVNTDGKFNNDWLKNDFIAPCNGTVYQIATKTNTFIKFVFVPE